jgi:hypothetical protein
MDRIFQSENGYYEVQTEDYTLDAEKCEQISDNDWQEFTDRLGEEFAKIDDKCDTNEYEQLWNDAHNKVCGEFPNIFD